MKATIPTYNIEILSKQTAKSPDIFFADHSITNHFLSGTIPYRSNYYGIGICLQGNATLKANLETYHIKPNCIVTMSPQIVKQWVYRAEDHKTMAVFFTKEFFINNNADKNYLDSFAFFDATAQHVSKFNSEQTEIIVALLQNIQQKLNSSHTYKNEIVRSLITILLFEISAIYNQEIFPSFYKQTRSEQITFEFKKLVNLHFINERSVNFFADLLFISPKHLTEIIKTETGKSAKEWIDETVILEAKILLQDTNLTVSNVTSMLNFSDQSIFGKFFKNLTKLSPLEYRQSL